MDVQDWLRTVVADCSLLTQPSEAIALAPDIAVDGPALVGVRPEGAKDPWFGFPTAFSERLSGPLVDLLGERLVALKRGEQEELSELAPSRLADDKLFSVLTELLLETSGFGPRPASLVALEVARQAAAVLAGDLEALGTTAAGRQTQALSEGRAWYTGLEGRERGATIARLVWSLTGRLSAAWTVCEEIDPRIRPTRFYQALVKNKLAFGLPSGALGSSADLDVVAGMLGIDVQRSLLDACHRGLTAGVRAALDGKPGPVANGIRDLAGLGASPDVVVFDPRITALVVSGLAELVDAKALQAAGLPKQEAKALLKGEGARPIIAAWTQAASALRTWDLLAAAAGRCVPVRRRGNGAHSRLGTLEASSLFSLLVPRGSAVTNTSVVAVQLANAWREVGSRTDKAPGVAAAMAGLVERLRREAAAQGGLSQVLGSVALFAFDGAGTASAFQDRAREVLGTTLRLQRGALGDDVLLSEDGLYAIEVATGDVFGGFAGGQLRIWGPAVDRAIHGVAAVVSDEGPAEESSVDWGGSQPAASLRKGSDDKDAFEDAFESPEYSDVDWGESTPEPEPEPETPPVYAAPAASDESEPLAYAEPEPEPEPAAELEVEEDDEDFEFEVDEAALPEVDDDDEPAWDEEPVADSVSEVNWGAADAAGEAEPLSEEPESQEGNSETFFLPPPDLAELEDVPDDAPEPEPEVLTEPESRPSSAEPDEGAGLGFALGPTLDEDGEEEPPPPAEEEDDGFFDPDSEDLVEMDSSIAWLTSKVSPTEETPAEAAETSSTPAASTASTSSGGALPDLEYLFQGYVTFDDPDGGVVFGRRYGGRLFDVHAYGDGDRGQAYLNFLNDKVREGFVPRSDLTRQIPTGVQVADLDLEEMGRAYRAIS